MDWALALNAVSSAALVAAVLFGVVQLRRESAARREQAAIEIVRSMQTREWASAVGPVGALPLPARARLHERDAEAAAAVGLRLETLGYLVYRGIVPVEVAYDLVGGITAVAWERLAAWVESDRAHTGNRKSYEWFEWLARRFDSLPSTR